MRVRIAFIVATVLLVIGAATRPFENDTPPDPFGPIAAAYGAPSTQHASVNLSALPLGDGHVGSSPRKGWVDSCTTSFGNGGGAFRDGPWINSAAHTWNYATKLAVSGSVRWPDASYRVTVSGTRRTITFNDLPLADTTGTFPIASNDPAYQYDRNPNSISAQSFSWSLARNPKPAGSPGCVPMGPIGVLEDGVVLYNALDGEGRDAGAHEVLDACGGHPDMSSTYHHHDIPPCILRRVRAGHSALVGYALDGYGIYVVKTRSGALPTDSQLDACHGTTGTVTWNGRTQRTYHYVATLEYPYTVGCFHGTAVSSGRAGP